MQRRSLKWKMQLMQLWKECFKNLGLPGFLTLSLLASSWLATRRPHEFLSEWSKLFRQQTEQPSSKRGSHERSTCLAWGFHLRFAPKMGQGSGLTGIWGFRLQYKNNQKSASWTSVSGTFRCYRKPWELQSSSLLLLKWLMMKKFFNAGLVMLTYP